MTTTHCANARYIVRNPYSIELPTSKPHGPIQACSLSKKGKGRLSTERPSCYKTTSRLWVFKIDLTSTISFTDGYYKKNPLEHTCYISIPQVFGNCIIILKITEIFVTW